MLEFLKVRNIALIDEIEIEFGEGLNLLTGETGSGKSIIVDSLGTLTGGRVSADLIKTGTESASIEGLFTLPRDSAALETLAAAGIEIEETERCEIIIRRELSAGRNRIFINGQLTTQAVLRSIGPSLVAIHGQGEQSELFDRASHLLLLDRFAGVFAQSETTKKAFTAYREKKNELTALKTDEAEKLRLVDVLRFQIDEISRANLRPDEEGELKAEKLRLNNVEKLSALSSEVFELLYNDASSSSATIEKAHRKVEELAQFEPKFADYFEGLNSASAVIEDLAITARDLGGRLEFSPERLEEIENRLAEILRLSRKYGGTAESVLQHLAESEKRLDAIETSELREKELRAELAERRDAYLTAALELSKKRSAAARRFEKSVEASLKNVALEKARFEVRIQTPNDGEFESQEFDEFSPDGIDRVEFFFTANPGEPPKPLARVASGGEASRLMLILKTAAGSVDGGTSVFDEIDAGIGGRVAEAVGLKLRSLAGSQQVLCVTHQPQVASKADKHFLIEKTMNKSRTVISVRELKPAERVEEIARMLAGEKITAAARENAKELIASA